LLVEKEENFILLHAVKYKLSKKFQKVGADLSTVPTNLGAMFSIEYSKHGTEYIG
jgi:hypothetical protein